MTTIRALIGAAAVAALPFAASAFTFVDGDYTGDQNDFGNGISYSIDPDSTEMDFDFFWNATPYSGYITFTAHRAFDLFFENYIPNAAVADQYSGLALMGPDGSFLQTGDANSNGCSDAAFSEIAGPCNLVTGQSGTAPFIKPDQDRPLFANLDAGTYTIGLDESNRPVGGSADFRAAAVVPLPAGGLLLLGALGGVAALRRRGKTDA